MLLGLWPVALLANPTGGTVVSGSATIATNGNTLNVNTGSSQTIIDWSHFGIDAGEITNINQPNSGSTTLNRVIGGNVSAIYGTLNSNGNVILINPNGVLIGAGGVVNTQSFTASTLDLSNSDFLNGVQHFTGTSTASVVNLGQITANGGDIFLIAQHVSNGGSLTARNGTVGLAAGTDVTIQAGGTGNQRLSVALDSATVARNSTGVDNQGTIDAVKAELVANGNIYSLAVNNGGIIRATGSGNVGGQVWLLGHGGTVKNTGTITAKNADGRGGKIETSGDVVSVAGMVQTGAGGQWLIDPLTLDNSTDIAVATLQGQLESGDVQEQATSSITLNESLSWSGTGTLTLQSGTIDLNGAITAGSGGLTLTAAGTITASAAISVGKFTLTSGNWVQNGSSLPSFYARDFTLSGGTFLRVLGGDGSSSTPYLLGDVYGLQGVKGFLSSDFTLANDIDASGTTAWNGGSGFAPIGSSYPGYGGTFNGAGHIVDGLTIQRTGTNDVALFGLSLGVIENVGLTNVVINGNGYVGGLVGANGGTVTGSYTTGVISGVLYVGGLVGYNTGTITNSHSDASVGGYQNVGGLAGYNANLIDLSYATGNATGTLQIGGLAGWDTGTIRRSYATGYVRATSTLAGGLVGYLDAGGLVQYSYATGAVYGFSSAGGLVGEIYAGALIDGCYATGAVDSYYNAGGLVAVAQGGAIQGSYATGVVTSSSGWNAEFLCQGYVGIANSYWATDTGSPNGFWTTSGFVNDSSGLTLAQLTDAANFQPLSGNWDFTAGTGVWGVKGYTDTGLINGGLPYFQWQYPTIALTASNQTAVYGQSQSANLSAVLGTTYTVAGLGTANLSDYLSGTPTLSKVGSNSTVGTTNVLTIAGTPTAGHAVEYVAGTQSFSPAPLEITVSSQSKTYGTNQALNGTDYTITAGQLYNSDSLINISLSSSGATATANVGTYAITAGNPLGYGLGNYQITYIDGVDTVTPASLVVVAGNGSKTYGTAQTLSGYNLYGQLYNGDSLTAVTLSSAGSSATANAGTYAITAGAATGSGLGNYQIAYVDGVDTVNPAPLTIEAGSATKTYGTAQTLSGYGITSGSLYNGDTLSSVTLSSGGTAATASVGAYAVTASNATGSGLGNYQITYVDGVDTVNPATVMLTVGNATSTYGSAPGISNIQIGASGLVNGETVADLGFVTTTSVTASTHVGTYSFTTSAGNSNYNYIYATGNAGTWTVTAAPLTITAGNITLTTGSSLPALGVSYGGLVNGDTSAVVSGLTVTTSGTGASAGKYAIIPGNGTASDYLITFVDGFLTVNSPVVELGSGPSAQLPNGETVTIPSAAFSPKISIPNTASFAGVGARGGVFSPFGGGVSSVGRMGARASSSGVAYIDQ
ncbi:filamentous hemagglutinin family N-terminal domain-containing protein [Verrucomicrobium sp. GAS474]|uniref:beta strand repeat-containing protein n=1 Tax=Verrucomicrobium sp. GAS474 TaxID=1882831 RepID=UPI000879E3B7|nr:MBG domain-containing protein [Verrucomicrobium sp. GAS474]SDU03073.1 filamentous hemagglutinin family N-terminal domain-containing protein [Verrucomicrobium sp. GAS474]